MRLGHGERNYGEKYARTMELERLRLSSGDTQRGEDGVLVSLDSKPIRPDVASRWLLKAETKAKLPKITGGLFHPYRRLWASERKMLPDVDVAAAGGWRDTQALKLSYQQSDAATVLSVVEH